MSTPRRSTSSQVKPYLSPASASTAASTAKPTSAALSSWRGRLTPAVSRASIAGEAKRRSRRPRALNE